MHDHHDDYADEDADYDYDEESTRDITGSDRCGRLPCLRRPPVAESPVGTALVGGYLADVYRCRQCGHTWTASWGSGGEPATIHTSTTRLAEMFGTTAGRVHADATAGPSEEPTP